jgi:aminoglycoside phosphotransferase (APT) family kinase protein
VNLRGADGRLQRLVLRRYVRRDWLAREPDLAAREASVLRRVDGMSLPTPRLLAVDSEAGHCDVPAVLSERLPGQIRVEALLPDEYFSAMAVLLPPIHAVETDPAFERSRPYFTYADLASLQPASWSHDPASWTRVIEEAQRAEPATARTFIHRDFHPGNLLWQRGRVSGVVDWVNASYGPPGIDLGHCRVNCAILFGVEGADRFLSAYLEQPEAVEYEPHWDCRTLVEALGEFAFEPTQWHDVGRTELDHAAIAARLDAYAASLCARLD